MERLGVVSGSLELTMPDTDLVFLGDVCDRGFNSKDIYDLIVRWQEEAPSQGSRVWFVIGNHEVMNSFGLRHYNTAEEYLSFDASSTAAGSRAHADAFASGGWLFEWLTQQRFALSLGGLVFAHADLPPLLSEWTVDEINERTMELYRLHAPGAGPQEGHSLPDALFSPDRSIIWCRQAQLGPARGYGRSLESFLRKNRASAYICGHTPSEEGSFRMGYGNRYLCIDTAMTFERQGVGRKSALLVEGGSAHAAYFGPSDIEYHPVELNFAPPPPLN